MPESHYNRYMQFQVPQFIETEDKIVGPLTLKQFIIVGVGVGLSGMLYFVLQTWLWIILSVFLVGGAGAMAFVKIQGRPLLRVIMSAFNFYWSPQTYVWQPEHPRLASLPREKAAGGPVFGGATLEKIAQGMALHKSWEKLQTGERMSDKQFTEQKMYGRYQIFQKLAGDRQAARRVDYR
jgi:hypothetical protein